MPLELIHMLEAAQVSRGRQRAWVALGGLRAMEGHRPIKIGKVLRYTLFDFGPLRLLVGDKTLDGGD